jgi:hypothetical protein
MIEAQKPDSAFIFGARRCGLARRFTSLARSCGLATRRAPFSSHCGLLAGCECNLRFGFHGLSLSLNGRKSRAKLIELGFVRMVLPATQCQPRHL